MAENNESEERWQWHYPRIARLYETAEINQKNITEAITELKRTTAALPTRVARDVNQKLDPTSTVSTSNYLILQGLLGMRVLCGAKSVIN